MAGGFPAVISGTKALRLYLLTARARDVKPAARSLATTQADVSRNGATNAPYFNYANRKITSVFFKKKALFICILPKLNSDVAFVAPWREIQSDGNPVARFFSLGDPDLGLDFWSAL